MIILVSHIIASIIAFVLGFPLFFTALKSNSKSYWLYWIFMVLLLISAITGAFLNLVTFSAFHILVIVTLINIPYSCYVYFKGDEFTFRENLFQNYCGLSLAFIGTLFPARFLGNRMFIEGFGLDADTSSSIVWVLLITGILLTIALVIMARKRKLPFSKYLV